MSTLYLSPREFGLRVGLKPSRVTELLRAQLIPGASRRRSGRWRIPETAVAAYQQGVTSVTPDDAAGYEELSRRLWRLYGEGACPSWLSVA